MVLSYRNFCWHLDTSSNVWIFSDCNLFIGLWRTEYRSVTILSSWWTCCCSFSGHSCCSVERLMDSDYSRVGYCSAYDISARPTWNRAPNNLSTSRRSPYPFPSAPPPLWARDQTSWTCPGYFSSLRRRVSSKLWDTNYNFKFYLNIIGFFFSSSFPSIFKTLKFYVYFYSYY